MPKTFSDQERETIRSALISKGRELFAEHGIRGTGVGDLAKAAGISAGSFYAFYDSKEELYFDVLEEEEKYRDELMGKLLSFEKLTPDALYALFAGVFDVMENNPVIRRLYEEGEFELLSRKLPKGRLEAHMKKDGDAMKGLFQIWQREGRFIQEDPEVISGLFRALFFMTFHKHEIGDKQYPRVRELLLRFVAEGLVTEPDEGRKK